MAYSAFFWWAVALVIIGILLLLAGAIWFAATRKSEWYIWLLVGLGALFLIIGIILFIYDYSRAPSDLMMTSGCGTVRQVPVQSAPVTSVVGAACPPSGCYTQYAPAQAALNPLGTQQPTQYAQPQVAHTVGHTVGHAVVNNGQAVQAAYA